MNKIASEAVEQLRKYISPLGAGWYLVNIVFRVGMHQLAPKVYSDDMKEFVVGYFVLQTIYMPKLAKKWRKNSFAKNAFVRPKSTFFTPFFYK